LVKVVEFLREEICALGGEFRFSSKVTDISLQKQPVVQVSTAQAAIKIVVSITMRVWRLQSTTYPGY
jgi:uncharacterized FAD-dependent dehydrogenase